MNLPTALPVSNGRPSMSPFQNGMRGVASPGAGTTSTVSWPIWVMRQTLDPRRKLSPSRDS